MTAAGAPRSTYYTPEGPLGDIFRALGPRMEKASDRGGRPGRGRRGRLRARRAGDGLLRDQSRWWSPWPRNRGSSPTWPTPPRRVRVRLGDGRLGLAEAPEGTYDLLVIDAFNSDAVPVHLLTREAVELYHLPALPRRGDRLQPDQQLPRPGGGGRRGRRLPLARGRLPVGRQPGGAGRGRPVAISVGLDARGPIGKRLGGIGRRSRMAAGAAHPRPAALDRRPRQHPGRLPPALSGRRPDLQRTGSGVSQWRGRESNRMEPQRYRNPGSITRGMSWCSCWKSA